MSYPPTERKLTDADVLARMPEGHRLFLHVEYCGNCQESYVLGIASFDGMEHSSPMGEKQVCRKCQWPGLVFDMWTRSKSGKED
jgi:hypothetical protein